MLACDSLVFEMKNLNLECLCGQSVNKSCIMIYVQDRDSIPFLSVHLTVLHLILLLFIK